MVCLGFWGLGFLVLVCCQKVNIWNTISVVYEQAQIWDLFMLIPDLRLSKKQEGLQPCLQCISDAENQKKNFRFPRLFAMKVCQCVNLISATQLTVLAKNGWSCVNWTTSGKVNFGLSSKKKIRPLFFLKKHKMVVSLGPRVWSGAR